MEYSTICKVKEYHLKTVSGNSGRADSCVSLVAASRDTAVAVCDLKSLRGCIAADREHFLTCIVNASCFNAARLFDY